MGLTSLKSSKILCTKDWRQVRLSVLTSLQPHLNLTFTSCSLDWNHLIMSHMTTIRTFESK